MIKISGEELDYLKVGAIDIHTFSKGNFWIIHSDEDNKVYAIKHAKGQYWKSKGTNYVTEVLRVCVDEERAEYTTSFPASTNVFRS